MFYNIRAGSQLVNMKSQTRPSVELNKVPTYEPHCEKTVFAYAKTKTQISCAVTAQLISAFVFCYTDSTIFLKPKFQASNHLL